MDWLKRNISALVSIISAIVLVFLSGITWAFLQLPGASLVRNTIDAAQDWRANAPAYLGRVPLKHLQPRRFKEDGLLLSDPAHTAPGVTFMTGLFGQRLGARLYAVDGTLIHEWPINFFDVARDAMRYPFDALLHGDYLYPNGDILTNVDGIGMFRVSACGDIRWQNRAGSHHSLFVDEEGFVWTPTRAREYRDTTLRKEPFNFDRVAKFNADTGATLEEIDLVKVLEDSQLEGLALANRMMAEDAMHLNDVEVLSSAMAPAFPNFVAGDLLLSSRNFSQLWVIDRKTRQLKWWYAGPIVGQHDPDFQPDGTITVFDNHPDGKSPGESRILRIDPRTKHYETLYAGSGENHFFSAYRGKHQLMANDNLLITETDAGRVFEVTKEGRPVWSFINGWDENRVAWIMSATRYPPEYASIGQISCASK